MKKYHTLTVKLPDGVEFMAKVRGKDIESVRAWLDASECSYKEVGAVSPMRPHSFQDNKIAQARMAKGWTQQELADALGLPQQNVQRWEAGKLRPRTATLMRIGSALGVDWVSLVDE